MNNQPLSARVSRFRGIEDGKDGKFYTNSSYGRILIEVTGAASLYTKLVDEPPFKKMPG